MINFRFILLGVLVGILSTIGFQELSHRRDPSYPGLDTVYKAPGPETVENTSPGYYPGIRSQDDWDEDYLIVPREPLFQKFRTAEQPATPSTTLNTDITNDHRMEHSGFDGAWDERLIMADDTEYFYGKEDRFPVYIKSMTNEVVRIDGSYFDLHQQEGRKFVIRDGDKLEVDFSDVDHLKLTPLLDRESDANEREYTEVDLQNYQSDTNRSSLEPLPIPLTQEIDDQLQKEGLLPVTGN